MTPLEHTPQSTGHSRLSRRQLIAAGLGGIVLNATPREAIAPGRDPKLPVERNVNQAEADKLEANLYVAAEKYGLSLAPKSEIQATLDELKDVQTEAEAIFIASNFTERQFGFPVLDTQEESFDEGVGERMSRLVSNLSLLPRELYEAIELQSIDLGMPPLPAPRGGVVNASFTTSLESGNIVTFLPQVAGNLHILLHELSHGIDFMNRTSDGSNTSLVAAYRHLNEGFESEILAEDASGWMEGKFQKTDRTSRLFQEFVEGLDVLVPDMSAYIEEALQPLLQAYFESWKPYQLFQ